MTLLVKKVFLFIFIVLALLGLIITVEAHSGKTDSAGGHYDRSSGEYHYHHGYPAHQHNNGICPYDYRDNTKHDYQNDKSQFGEILIIIIKIIWITLGILIWGFIVWLFVYMYLTLLLSRFCKNILKVDANESVISKITIVTILVISVIISSLIVLNL